MIFNIINSIKGFDKDLGGLIEKSLKPYDPYKNPPVVAALIPLFLKVVFYSVVIILPFLVLKLLFPYKKWINYFLYIIIAAAGLAVFGVLLGFIQLLFTF